MLIQRWQAPIIPNETQIKLVLQNEGLEPYDEVLEAGSQTREHKHPFCEVRVLIKGELSFNISGNRIVLRPGDRLEIPANTKHSYSVLGSEKSVSVCGMKAI